jgi:NADH dehydrogenase
MYGVPINGMLGWVLRLGFFLRFMPQRRRAIAVLRLLTSTARRRANLAKTDRPAATADGSFGVGANVEPAAA